MVPENWSPQRERGVREAKAYSRAIERGIPLHDPDVFLPGEVLVTCEDVVTREMLAPFVPAKALLAMREPHWQLLVRAVSAWCAEGGAGFTLKHKHVPAIADVAERSSERVLPEMVALGLFVVVCPLHVKHGASAVAPKSRADGYAFYVHPGVLHGMLAGVVTDGGGGGSRATSAANAEASRPELERERSCSPEGSPTAPFRGGGGEPPRSKEMPPHELRTIEPSQQAAQQLGSGGASREWLAELRDVWREMAASGNEYAQALSREAESGDWQTELEKFKAKEAKAASLFLDSVTQGGGW